MTEVQSRSDAEARGAAVYVHRPSLQNLCLWKRWPAAHQIRAAEAEAGTGLPRELKGDRQTETGRETGDGASKQQDGGGSFDANVLWNESQSVASRIIFICFPNSLTPPTHRPTYSCSQMFGLNFTKAFHPLTNPPLPLIWFFFPSLFCPFGRVPP